MTATPIDREMPAGAPSWWLFAAEPLRAACEFAGAQLMNRRALPTGDGHAVVLFPGLATDARSLSPLRHLCTTLGYETHDWGRGFNTGPGKDVDAWLDALADDVRRMVEPNTLGTSLIGWSLGGIIAREIGRKLPQHVRQVITIGTPFAGAIEHTHAGFVYRLLNGSDAPVSAALRRRLASAPGVPTTSIYSRSDGIVAWEACIQRGGVRSENVEVSGSHCGLGWNAEVFGIVAERLSQPAGGWRPLRRVP